MSSYGAVAPSYSDSVYVLGMAQQLERGSEKLFLTALGSCDCKLRAAALVAAPKFGRTHLKALLDHLADGSSLVRQAARTGLIRLSMKYAKNPGLRDFGPAPEAGPLECMGAAEVWKVWFAENTVPVRRR